MLLIALMEIEAGWIHQLGRSFYENRRQFKNVAFAE